MTMSSTDAAIVWVCIVGSAACMFCLRWLVRTATRRRYYNPSWLNRIIDVAIMSLGLILITVVTSLTYYYGAAIGLLALGAVSIVIALY